VCAQAICRDALEMELDYDAESTVETFRVHRDCFTAWNLERLEAPASPSVPAISRAAPARVALGR
jgi:hypothetical protein